MSPKDPDPIFLPSRYLLPTRSSMMRQEGGDALVPRPPRARGQSPPRREGSTRLPRPHTTKQGGLVRLPARRVMLLPFRGRRMTGEAAEDHEDGHHVVSRDRRPATMEEMEKWLCTRQPNQLRPPKLLFLSLKYVRGGCQIEIQIKVPNCFFRNKFLFCHCS